MTGSTLTERAQGYWETLNDDEAVTAEDLFEYAKEGEPAQDIKYIRGFLTRKYNDGLAFLIPSQSPPTYIKQSTVPTALSYCVKVFNHLPEGEQLSTVTFKNRLPQIFKEGKGADNFFFRAKAIGALKNVTDDTGEVVKDGGCMIVEKVANVNGSTLNQDYIDIKRGIKPVPVVEQSKPKELVDRDKNIKQMSAIIDGMTPSEAGMLLFEFLNTIKLENENLRSMVNILKEENERLKTVVGKEEKTYAEIFKSKE